MDIEKFYREVKKFYDDIKKKPKSPYTDGYRDAIRYILDWMEEFV